MLSSRVNTSYMSPVQVDRDEGGGNGEVVHEGVELQHEPELVRGGDKLRDREYERTVESEENSITRIKK